MDVLMPQLGETVTEGTLARWCKSAGDKVENGEILFEIETDKTSMEIPATCTGILSHIKVAQGAVVAVGTVVATIDIAGASAVADNQIAPTAATPPSPATVPYNAQAAHGSALPAKSSAGRRADGVLVTPLARRLAARAGISVNDIRGSGPHGRVIGRDVEAHTSQGTQNPKAAIGVSPPSPIGAQYQGVPFVELPLDGMRRTIARRLVEAKQTIPHFYLSCSVDVDAVDRLRRAANDAVHRFHEGEPPFKLSLNDCMIKALAVALQRVPAANAILADDRILQFGRVDIGVAVAIDGGLITPVLRGVDAKSLATVSNEMKQLATRARARKLLTGEYQGGSITVSNLGMYGITEFAAIINPPQSAILAIGAANRVASEAEDGSVRFVTRIHVTMSCDHRVIDGAVAALLLKEFKAAVESPMLLFT